MQKTPSPKIAVVEERPRAALWAWIWTATFAVAFAWVESAVVVYLREIYFPHGFSFPLVFEWENGRLAYDPLASIELGREGATLLMLIAAGAAAGRNPLQGFSFFMIAFGLWDIFYYIWLWVMIRWPSGLMEWDLLFLLPLPWTGPVITPVMIAVMLVVAGTLLVYLDERGYRIRLRWYDFAVEFFFATLLIIAFCWDWKNIMRLPGETSYSGIPNPFFWSLFLPAYAASVIYFFVRIAQIVRRGS